VRKARERAEEAVGREIDATVDVTARDPSNHARRDDCLERVMTQAVAFVGMIEMCGIAVGHEGFALYAWAVAVSSASSDLQE
jgi:hypothetical protein